MKPIEFFRNPQTSVQRQYETLRAFFLEKKSAKKIAAQFDYKLNTVYSLISDFRKICAQEDFAPNHFFNEKKPGPKPDDCKDGTIETIVSLRKKNLSVFDIKAILDARNQPVSRDFINRVLRKEGFVRLPRRGRDDKDQSLAVVPVEAPTATLLQNDVDDFNSENIGILCFLPYIIMYGLHDIINLSSYPDTKTIPVLNSILSFLALKLSNIRRYTVDDLWCMDKGLGLFAGLNVLPKAAWFSSYSHRITRDMNLKFLKQLHQLWVEHGLLSDTANLDFVTIPYWGDDGHLENNWSGTRHHALSSILAALSHDPDSGIITYADTTIRHERSSRVVLEFLDFYRKDLSNNDIRYLVFDSKFTTYKNLKRLDEDGIYFLTIRRRGTNIVKELNELPASEWKTIRVLSAGQKSRTIKVHESKVHLRDYGKKLRQIAIKGNGRIKPALIITNDFDKDIEFLVRKYAKRWLVEKTISEQTHFFHLNRLSSSMVIKVDFDLTMSILAHNIYKLLARELPGYEKNTAATLYEKFIHNGGTVEIDEEKVCVSLRKKRHHPVLFTALYENSMIRVPWLKNRKLHLEIASSS